MTNPDYDPQKAHDYYERTKHLKGRNRRQTEDFTKSRGSTKVRPRRPGEPMANMVTPKQSAQMRVVRLTEKIHKLNDALHQAQEALRNKREEARKNSDGKTTAKERADAKKYRDTHKSELATKRKKDSSSSGSSSTSSSGPKSVSEMSESELTDRISRIRGAISDAKTQLQEANSLAHSLGDSNFISHSGPTTVNTH